MNPRNNIITNVKHMPEIQTNNQEQLKAWMSKNNMEVLNLHQISAILMKLEQSIELAHERIDQMQNVIDEALMKNNEPLMEIYDKAIEYLKKIKELESK